MHITNKSKQQYTTNTRWLNIQSFPIFMKFMALLSIYNVKISLLNLRTQHQSLNAFSYSDNLFFSGNPFICKVQQSPFDGLLIIRIWQDEQLKVVVHFLSFCSNSQLTHVTSPGCWYLFQIMHHSVIGLFIMMVLVSTSCLEAVNYISCSYLKWMEKNF